MMMDTVQSKPNTTVTYKVRANEDKGLNSCALQFDLWVTPQGIKCDVSHNGHTWLEEGNFSEVSYTLSMMTLPSEARRRALLKLDGTWGPMITAMRTAAE